MHSMISRTAGGSSSTLHSSCSPKCAVAPPKLSEIVILFGLARRTAHKSRKYHYFTAMAPSVPRALRVTSNHFSDAYLTAAADLGQAFLVEHVLHHAVLTRAGISRKEGWGFGVRRVVTGAPRRGSGGMPPAEQSPAPPDRRARCQGCLRAPPVLRGEQRPPGHRT